MKKILFILMLMFLLTGCNNSVTFDFKEEINTKINLSFSLDEYDYYSELNDKEELISSIEAIRNDREAFINGNGELFIENSYINNNDHYTASYEYNYNYSNFGNNSVMNTCFDYFGVEEDNDRIYVSIKGKSICSPFKLIVTADDRMLNSNEDKKINNEYIWNINEIDNNVYFSISKEKINNSSFNMFNLIYFIVALILGMSAYIINKKINDY